MWWAVDGHVLLALCNSQSYSGNMKNGFKGIKAKELLQ